MANAQMKPGSQRSAQYRHQRDQDSRLCEMANVNLHHLTMFFP